MTHRGPFQPLLFCDSVTHGARTSCEKCGVHQLILAHLQDNTRSLPPGEAACTSPLLPETSSVAMCWPPFLVNSGHGQRGIHLLPPLETLPQPGSPSSRAERPCCVPSLRRSRTGVTPGLPSHGEARTSEDQRGPSLSGSTAVPAS